LQAWRLRFRIELLETKPLVWREIEVPGTYTFWDLHVAIQDAMGWQDHHLHRFTIPHPRTKKPQIFGIHNLHQGCDDPPSWATQVASMFTFRNPLAQYEYDFGDDWQHTVRLIGVVRRDFKLTYPRCVGGERACPPEDCGGVHGFAEIVAGAMDEDTRRPLPRGYKVASIRARCASTTRRAAWRTHGMATRMRVIRRMGERYLYYAPRVACPSSSTPPRPPFQLRRPSL
jgi:hypothetical protein